MPSSSSAQMVHILGSGTVMEGEQTGVKLGFLASLAPGCRSNFRLDYIYRVVDMVPDTDFPDIRNRAAIHSDNGLCVALHPACRGCIGSRKVERSKGRGLKWSPINC
jgi:phenol 2-monooxygenase